MLFAQLFYHNSYGVGEVCSLPTGEIDTHSDFTRHVFKYSPFCLPTVYFPFNKFTHSYIVSLFIFPFLLKKGILQSIFFEILSIARCSGFRLFHLPTNTRSGYCRCFNAYRDPAQCSRKAASLPVWHKPINTTVSNSEVQTRVSAPFSTSYSTPAIDGLEEQREIRHISKCLVHNWRSRHLQWCYTFVFQIPESLSVMTKNSSPA